MNRLRATPCFCFLVAVVYYFSTPGFSAEAAQRPNVLIILADDLGYSDLGCFGGEIPTPNLDRLAAGGLRFTQCYNSSRCCPSRASLLTGLYPHQTGVGEFAYSKPDRKRGPAYLGHLNERCTTLAEVLGSAGYQTYMVGKWHVGEPGPVQRGFDEFYGFVNGYEQNQWEPSRYERLPAGRTPELSYGEGEFYATDVFTDYSLEFLKQARDKQLPDQQDRPWFLYLAHSAPHFPVQAPQESVERFVDTYRRGWDKLRAERFERMKQSGLAEPSWTLTERSTVPVDEEKIANRYSGQQNPAWDSLPEDRRQDLAQRMAIFAAMVSHVDQGVGRLLADLQAHGELDNTLIMFLSDNGACYEWGPFGFDGPSRKGITKLHEGEELKQMGGPETYHAYGSGWSNLCNTPLRLYKHFTHEGGCSSPLIVHWPAGLKAADRWVRDPVHVMDLMPTLCEVAGAEYPKQRGGKSIQPAEGQSLVPLFGEGQLAERAIALEHQGSRGLRRGKWKVVWPVRMPWESKWELYDVSTDRCETNDLAEQHPELCKQLSNEWLAWAKRVKVYPFFLPNSSDKRKSPQIDNRALTISADVNLPEQPATGVVLAQGGRQHGYALHLEQGRLIFSVRRNEQVTATPPYELSGKTAHIEARLLASGQMELLVDGKQVAKADAGGLLPTQPVDRLSIGRDIQTAVGNYDAPLPLDAKVTKVKVNGNAANE